MAERASPLIFGYAIVSADGMIADADGRMPEALIVEADQLFYQASLGRAQVVVHGRNSAESGPEADRRPRVVVTGAVAALSFVRTEPAILLWNPSAAAFAAVIEALGLDGGTAAIVGGTDVFDLFLGIGYDAFYLSRALRARLPGGRPVFRRAVEVSPEAILAEVGLRLSEERFLAPDATLSVWRRPAPAGSVR